MQRGDLARKKIVIAVTIRLKYTPVVVVTTYKLYHKFLKISYRKFRQKYNEMFPSRQFFINSYQVILYRILYNRFAFYL